MLLVVCGLAFLAGLMSNGSIIFIISCGKERTVDLLWSLNLAVTDFVFVLLLPIRVWSMSTNFDLLLTVSSSVTALHVVSRAFFLAAMTASCSVSVASPAWLEGSEALHWAFVAALVIWALSFAFSVRYRDLWEATMLSKEPKTEVGEWITTWPLSISVLVWFLCLLALIMVCYNIHTGKQKTAHHAWSRELIRCPFISLLCFFICWLPYHVLFFLLEMGLDAPADPSPGFISCCQVAFFLAYFSSCLDAIIRLSMNGGFGNHLQRSGNWHTPGCQHPKAQQLETLA